MFPQFIYRYASDVTRTPIGTVLTAYYGGDNTYDNARDSMLSVAYIRGDCGPGDEAFSNFIDQTALSMNYIVPGGADYVWKV